MPESKPLKLIFDFFPQAINKVAAGGKSLCFGVSIDKHATTISIACEDVLWFLNTESNDLVLRFGTNKKVIACPPYSAEEIASFVVSELAAQVTSRGGPLSKRKPTTQRRDVPVTIITVEAHEKLTGQINLQSIENRQLKNEITTLKKRVTDLESAVRRAKSNRPLSPERKFKRNQ